MRFVLRSIKYAVSILIPWLAPKRVYDLVEQLKQLDFEATISCIKERLIHLHPRIFQLHEHLKYCIDGIPQLLIQQQQIIRHIESALINIQAEIDYLKEQGMQDRDSLERIQLQLRDLEEDVLYNDDIMRQEQQGIVNDIFGTQNVSTDTPTPVLGHGDFLIKNLETKAEASCRSSRPEILPNPSMYQLQSKSCNK